MNLQETRKKKKTLSTEGRLGEKKIKISAKEIGPVLLMKVFLIIMESFTSSNISVCSMVGHVIKNP